MAIVVRGIMGTDPPVLTLEQAEMLHIARVLDTVSGNKTKAARLLGIDRRTLYRKLAKAARGQGR